MILYKVISGDENAASDMAFFCNQIDLICNETGYSTICCHYHYKGVQGAKRAIDRASGSGVFARDPDAQLDMSELELYPELRGMYADANATAWRLEGSLCEFADFEPVNFWFEYPIHYTDKTGILQTIGVSGSPQANLVRSGKRTSVEKT